MSQMVRKFTLPHIYSVLSFYIFVTYLQGADLCISIFSSIINQIVQTFIIYFKVRSNRCRKCRMGIAESNAEMWRMIKTNSLICSINDKKQYWLNLNKRSLYSHYCWFIIVISICARRRWFQRFVDSLNSLPCSGKYRMILIKYKACEKHVEMYFNGVWPQKGPRQSLLQGGSAPRLNPTSFYIPFLTQKVPLSYTFSG